MIVGFASDGGRLRSVGDSLADLGALIWIDLLNPSAEEEALMFPKPFDPVELAAQVRLILRGQH